MDGLLPSADSTNKLRGWESKTQTSEKKKKKKVPEIPEDSNHYGHDKFATVTLSCSPEC